MPKCSWRLSQGDEINGGVGGRSIAFILIFLIFLQESYTE
jgi:hypothetical protein